MTERPRPPLPPPAYETRGIPGAGLAVLLISFATVALTMWATFFR